MTLIATFTVNHFPVLMGDILMSAPNADKAAHIPTIGDVANFESMGCRISGLKQKVCIINDHLTLAWAGTRVACKMIIKNLISETSKHPLTYDDLPLFFKDISKDVGQLEVAFVGCMYQEGKGFRKFAVNHQRHFQSDIFGDVWIAGSGSSDFENFLRQFRTFPLSVSGREPNPLEMATAVSLGAAGALLQEELLASPSLRNLYGGGYEVASFVEKKFQKVGNFSYLFWTLRIDGKNIFFSKVPEKVLKFAYMNDILLIRSVTLGDMNQNNKVSLLGNDLFIIDPIFDNGDKQEIATIVPPDLNSQFIGNFVLVLDKERGVRVLAKVDYVGTTEKRMVFTDEGEKGISFSVRSDYIMELVETTVKTLKHDPQWADLGV